MIRKLAATLVASMTLTTLNAPAQTTQKQVVMAAPARTSLSATGVDLYDALQAYARHARINIYIDPSTPHVAQSFLIRNVSDAEAFRAIIKANGLASIERNSVTYVGPPSAIARYSSSAITSATIPTAANPTLLSQSLSALLPPGTQVYPEDQSQSVLVIGSAEAVAQARSFLMPPTSLVYARFTPANGRSAKDLITLYQALYPYVSPDELVLDGSTNTVLLRGSRSFVDGAASSLASLDTPVPQVFYDVNIIEMTPETYNLNRGILFGGINTQGQQIAGSGSTTITSATIKSVPFNLTINALESQGKATILRRPSLVIANGSNGTSQDTTTIPYSVPNSLTGIPTIAQVTTGVILTATPTVAGSIVHTTLQESYTAATGIGTQGIPITETNAVNTIVDSTPDDVIVISGLLADDDSTTMTGLPPFNHLFFLGGLFRNRQASKSHVEVLVTLQAHVDYPGRQHVPVQFSTIPDALLHNGIAPAPTPLPTAHP